MTDRSSALTFSTLIIAILAIGGVRLPNDSRSSGTTRRETAAQEATEAARALVDGPYSAADLLESFYGTDQLNQVACGPPLEQQCYDVDVTIVSVPDPMDSYLDWSFDAGIEAVRRAYETAGYVTDRFWLPWHEDRRLARARLPSLMRRNFPGILIFRSTDPTARALRVVYLVGEVASGVHREALLKALDGRDSLLRADLFRPDSSRMKLVEARRDTIRVVGPFFSGAALSVRLTLDRWRTLKPGRTQFASFLSGSATGWSNLVVFDSARRFAWPSIGKMRFRATVNPDSVLTTRMLTMLRDSVGIPANQIALLQESSTQYGQQSIRNLCPGADTTETTAAPIIARRSMNELPKDGAAAPADTTCSVQDSFLSIPFPMSISSLRAEYAKYPTEGQSPQTSTPRIPLPEQDSLASMDNPTPSSRLTPAALDLMMAEITTTLNAHRVRYIGIVGTDIRDKLFLADELRKRVPDARLFTLGSNRLFLRPEFNRSLRGMLVFSTYPLFLENTWWANRRVGDTPRLSFVSDDAQGIFNAALIQLGARDSVFEYMTPFNDSILRPPIWVTQIGRHGILPIAFKHDSAAASYVEAVSPPSPLRGKWTLARPDRRKPWLLIVSVICAALVIVALTSYSDSRLREHTQSLPAPDPEYEEPSQGPVARMVGETSALDKRGLFQATVVRRKAQRGVMMIQREVFTVLRHWAILVVFASVSLVLPRADGYSTSGTLIRLLLLLTLVVGLFVFGVFVYRWDVLRREYSGSFTKYFLQKKPNDGNWLKTKLKAGFSWLKTGFSWLKTGLKTLLKTGFTIWFRTWLKPWFTTWFEILVRPVPERNLWRAERIMTAVVFGLGLVFTWISGQFIWDVIRLQYAEHAIMLFRAQQLDSGASPVVVLVLGAAALALWTTWHLHRIALVDDTTAFEETLLYREDRRDKTALEKARRDLSKEIRSTRRRLSCILPRQKNRVVGWLMGVFAVGLAVSVFFHFERSPEAFLFGLNVGDVFGRKGIVTRFDVILRMGFICTFAATVWTLWRYIAVWRSLELTLKRVAASPLITAFERLPRRISRLTRLTVFTEPSRSVVETVTHTQWLHLGQIFAANPKAFSALYPEARAELSELIAGAPPPSGKRARKPFTTAERQLRHLLMFLESFWKEEPRSSETSSVIEGLKSAKETEGISTSGRIRRGFPDAVRLWVRTAEEYAATEVVAYITWVFRYLRRLVQLLLGMLILMMLLLASYSFSPESVIRPTFVMLFVATIVTLLASITQLNKDEVLSRIQRTDPGRIKWDANYLINIGLVILVPLLGLLSSFAPWVQDGASWIDPIARSLTSR